MSLRAFNQSAIPGPINMQAAILNHDLTVTLQINTKLIDSRQNYVLNIFRKFDGIANLNRKFTLNFGGECSTSVFITKSFKYAHVLLASLYVHRNFKKHLYQYVVPNRINTRARCAASPGSVLPGPYALNLETHHTGQFEAALAVASWRVVLHCSWKSASFPLRLTCCARGRVVLYRSRNPSSLRSAWPLRLVLLCK